MLHVLDSTGDRVLEWAPGDVKKTGAAKTAFEEHLAHGGAVIRSGPAGDEVIRKFDPQAETLTAIPQIQGG
jgi:hypothetical protein